MSKSSIARVKGIAWKTVDRWLERAAGCCRRFNDQTITGLDMPELQADEIRTMTGGKDEAPTEFLCRRSGLQAPRWARSRRLGGRSAMSR